MLPPTKKAFAAKKSAIDAVVPAVSLSEPSLTVRVTLKTPVELYAWEVVAPVPVVASPKSHEYVSTSPSGSELAVPSKLTGTLSEPV